MQTFTLTAEDIQALRTADTIVFRHSGGQSQIEASKNSKAKPSAVFTPSQKVEARRIIQTGMACTAYHEKAWSRPVPAAKFDAFEMVHYAQSCEEWQGVAHSLRVGDEVKLSWGADSRSSPTMRRAGLHVDNLSLSVHRGRKWLAFLLSIVPSQPGSSRMIKLNDAFIVEHGLQVFA